MSFDISCHFTFRVILLISVIIVIIDTKVIMALMLKLLSRTGVCSKTSRCRIVIGRYGYKSSFGANKGAKDKVPQARS